MSLYVTYLACKADGERGQGKVGEMTECIDGRRISLRDALLLEEQYGVSTALLERVSDNNVVAWFAIVLGMLKAMQRFLERREDYMLFYEDDAIITREKLSEVVGQVLPSMKANNLEICYLFSGWWEVMSLPKDAYKNRIKALKERLRSKQGYAATRDRVRAKQGFQLGGLYGELYDTPRKVIEAYLPKPQHQQVVWPDNINGLIINKHNDNVPNITNGNVAFVISRAKAAAFLEWSKTRVGRYQADVMLSTFLFENKDNVGIVQPTWNGEKSGFDSHYVKLNWQHFRKSTYKGQPPEASDPTELAKAKDVLEALTLGRAPKRRRLAQAGTPLEVAEWFAKERGQKIWSHDKFVCVKATSGNEKDLRLGYIKEGAFVQLIQVSLTGSPIVKVEIEDFYFDNKAPKDIKEKFRAEGGPKGLILRGYAFIWYALEIAARFNAGDNWKEELAPLLHSFAVTDSWNSVKQETGKLTLNSYTLMHNKDVASSYAAAFEGYAKVTPEELATYLHESGIFWPFLNKNAIEKHGYNVGSAAAFVDYTGAYKSKFF